MLVIWAIAIAGTFVFSGLKANRVAIEMLHHTISQPSMHERTTPTHDKQVVTLYA
jgi:hypothetical protein